MDEIKPLLDRIMNETLGQIEGEYHHPYIPFSAFSGYSRQETEKEIDTLKRRLQNGWCLLRDKASSKEC
jgi:hypothetical protein